MKKTLAVICSVIFAAGMSLALTNTTTAGSGAGGGSAVPTIDVLGAHNNYGRGCTGCHAPHSGARGGGGNAVANGTVSDIYTGSNALFGQDMGPLFGQTFNFGDNGSFIYTAASNAASYTTDVEQMRGILMCLACHDGAIAKGAMMKNASYEQQIGTLPSSVYGTGTIPTLLGADGSSLSGSNAYNNDHPVGENATISRVLGKAYYNTAAGLTYAISNGTITGITVGTTYANFVSNYGAPDLLQNKWSSYPTPVNAAGAPYVVCTTCHNQHSMNIYSVAGTSTTIEGNATGTYTTFFFINAPYDPSNSTGVNAGGPSEVAQFCRQCHFGESNEASGAPVGGVFTTNLD